MKVRLIIVGTRPSKEIRDNAPLLEAWYEDHGDRVERMVRAALNSLSLRVEDVIEEITGKAEGWDTLGEMWARSEGIEVVEFPAEWTDKRGNLDRAAGVKRNRAMALYASQDGPQTFQDAPEGGRRMVRGSEGAGGVMESVVGVLVAAWDVKSAGTRNMIYEAEKAGCGVWCWADEEGEFDEGIWKV